MHILSRQKGDGDPWIAGKIKDDVEEFGYGGALCRGKSDQEPAIVDVHRAVIAKRGNAPNTPVNSPVGDLIQRTNRKRNQEGSKYHSRRNQFERFRFKKGLFTLSLCGCNRVRAVSQVPFWPKKFERFRGFLELISRFEFEVCRRENYFF